MQCKVALEEADGDMDKALIILKKKRSEAALQKSDRTQSAGTIGVYVHNTNEVAALVSLACETDFVSKNEEFIALAKDIAMHVTATDPKYISRDEVTDTELKKAKEVFKKEVEDKPKEMQEKILKGKLDSYFNEQILLEQPFIKNPDTTIGDLVGGAVQKFGENVSIAQISRVSVKQCMAFGLTYVGGSIGILLLLLLLFRHEEKRGKRVVLGNLRQALDGFVLFLGESISSFFETIGSKSGRIILHFVIHKLLRTTLNVLARCESSITRMLKSNRRLAKNVREPSIRTHLHEIADYKAETELTDEEKNKKKIESLG